MIAIAEQKHAAALSPRSPSAPQPRRRWRPGGSTPFSDAAISTTASWPRCWRRRCGRC